MVLSMGGFFTLMAIGLASRLPGSLYSGLTQAGVSPDAAHTIAHVPPVGTLFAAFLGDNPVKQLMQQVDPQQLQPGSGVDVEKLTGQSFFPHLISDPFMHGLLIAFGASIIMLLIAAGASLMRGERYVHADAHGDADGDAGRAAGHPHHSVGAAMASEGEALSLPALLEDEDSYTRS
jgi:hypothetical protein